MLIGGIDPGVNGAIALLRRDGSIYTTYCFCHYSLQELHSLLWDVHTFLGISKVFKEQVHSIKGDGHVGAFTFGKNVGHWEGLLASLGIHWEAVSPQGWQKELKCLTGGDKNISKRKALSLYPTHKITHANADAILIANYGLLKSNLNPITYNV